MGKRCGDLRAEPGPVDVAVASMQTILKGCTRNVRLGVVTPLTLYAKQRVRYTRDPLLNSTFATGYIVPS